MTRYALYRGDELVDVGTARELAEKLGVKMSTVQFMATPSHHKRKGNRLKAYRIEGADRGDAWT